MRVSSFLLLESGPLTIEKSVVVVAIAPRAIGHREQMRFIDATWHQAALKPEELRGP